MLKDPDLHWLSVVDSPLLEATKQCSLVFEEFYTDPNNRDIMRTMKQQALMSILTLPGDACYTWFENMATIRNEVFTDMSMGTLKSGDCTFSQVKSVVALVDDPDEKEKLRAQLFAKENTEKKPIVFKSILFKLNLTVGSR